MRKAASVSQSQQRGFKERLARGADFGHFPIAMGRRADFLEDLLLIIFAFSLNSRCLIDKK
jgi:hypothetical protein